MKLAKKLQAEILTVYHDIWDANLRGDIKTFASYMDKNVLVFGSAHGEILTSKKDAFAFYEATADQLAGKADFRNRHITTRMVGDIVMVNEQTDLYVLVDEQWIFYGHARITGIFEYKGNSWKVVHLHSSFPDSRTEAGQQIATKKIQAENLQLREAVKRRTVELEHKNRELEVESALEKVRTVAMSMKSPEDMLRICTVISQQLTILGLQHIRNVQTAIFYPDRGTFMNYEYYARYDKTIVTEVDFTAEKSLQTWAKKMMNSATVEFREQLKGKKLRDWHEYIKTTNMFVDEHILHVKSLNYYSYPLGLVTLIISTYGPLKPEESDLFKRFLNVFKLSFQRYLDIEMAQRQARAAQIEASLERIRAAAMAMRDSGALSGLIFKLYGELTQLDAKLHRCFIMIVNPENQGITWWMAGSEGLLAENGFFIPMNHHPSHLMYLEHWKNRTKKWRYLFEGKEKKDWDRFGFSKTELSKLPEFVKKDMSSVKKIHLCGSSDQFGSLVTGSLEPLPEEQQDILARFAIAFNQVYTRFLDLQKAEAQAREAQIEAALEKVRSRTMAMQKPEELADTAHVLFEQLRGLGVPHERVNIGIVDEAQGNIDFWLTEQGGDVVNNRFSCRISEPTTLSRVYKAWKKGDKSFVVDLQGEDLEKWIVFLQTEAYIPFNTSTRHTRRVHTAGFFSKGMLIISSPEPLQQNAIYLLERFAGVFDLTYTRFNDLKKAEVQAREATKQASLDRVRAVIASMRSADDLELITPLIFKELTILDVPFIRCGVFIIHEDQEIAEAYLSSPDGRSLGVLRLPYHASELTLHTVAAWRKGTVYRQHWNKEDFMAWTRQMMEQHQIQDSRTYQGTDAPPEHLELHFVPFTQGMLYVGAIKPLDDKELELVQALAKAFSIAYARYEDFIKLEKAKTDIESALAELKATQSQLIQQEKLASLGQLTAGIAHEIKNPLNFVNNFSELSIELIEEAITEMRNGNGTGDKLHIDELLSDIMSNLQKVHQHGSRANGIVNSMLQHSRTGTGQKEPTDINDLADEYLRLAFHGMRAKDKSFNAVIQTEFDPAMEKIAIVPQEIGRVMLNLFNNAFYAVHEKSKTASPGYQPTVTVTTSFPAGDPTLRPKGHPPGNDHAQCIILTVTDNGPGIPEEIKDKIFQPFFTTKPTGQGTGLGLSLSYDIIKAHGGALMADTIDGEGSEFIIILPVKETT